jgi:hypothetical protein
VPAIKINEMLLPHHIACWCGAWHPETLHEEARILGWLLTHVSPPRLLMHLICNKRDKQESIFDYFVKFFLTSF